MHLVAEAVAIGKRVLDARRLDRPGDDLLCREGRRRQIEALDRERRTLVA